MSVLRFAVKQGARLCAPSNQASKFNLHLPCISYKNNYSHKSSQLAQESSTQNSKSTNGNEVIYTGLLNKNIFKIKVLSLTTSTIGLTVQPIVYTQAVATGAASSWTLSIFGLIGAFAIATPLLLNHITKRYIISVELDTKEDKFIATYYNLFAMKKQFDFTPEDVTIPTILGMFSNCQIKGMPVFLDGKSFTDPLYFGIIMGYDKPVDMLVNNEPNTKKNEQKCR